MAYDGDQSTPDAGGTASMASCMVQEATLTAWPAYARRSSQHGTPEELRILGGVISGLYVRTGL
jgi:hypothetical protein